MMIRLIRTVVLFVAAVLLVKSATNAAVGPGGGGGAPNVTSLAPGAGFKAAVEAMNNGSVLQLGNGTYTVTSSILNSNLIAGSQFSGVTLANLTNVTILGVPGGSIIDARASTWPGELLWITNCSRVHIEGVTFMGYTNHNITLLPKFGTAGDYLWTSVNVYQCENLTFKNCKWIGSTGHALQDKGAEDSGAFVAAVNLSTNNILVEGCYFTDIGTWRTNQSTAANVWDGTCINPTGWTIRNCSFENVGRGVEPYNASDANSRIFYNCVIENNDFRNMVEFAISPAGSTNGHFVKVIGNRIINAPFSYHGSNLTTTPFGTMYGIQIGAGRGWIIKNNFISGMFQYGMHISGPSTPLDNLLVEGNTLHNISRGAGTAGYGMHVGVDTDSATGNFAVRQSIFRNNTAIGCDANGFRFCSGRDITVEGNTAYDNANLYLTAAGDAFYASGFWFGSGSYANNILTNWTIRNNKSYSFNSSPYGMAIDANVRYSVFEGNELLGAYDHNGGITNRSGANVAVLGIPRTYGAAVDLASIGINAAVDTVITAEGVTTNDAVTVQIPPQFWVGGAGAEVSYFAWATNTTATDGQIVLRVINSDTTAATVNFPSVNMIFQARQMRVHGQ